MIYVHGDYSILCFINAVVVLMYAANATLDRSGDLNATLDRSGDL